MELLIIIIFVLIFYFNRRLGKLEDEVSALKGQYLNGVTQSAVPYPSEDRSQSLVSDTVASSYTPIAVVNHSTETNPNAFVEWLKKDFLVKLGALLLLMGFGWFVSYAFANNWIGPVGRIVLGILAGIGFMMGGLLRIQKKQHQGSIFIVLGSTIVLLTIFAAQELYQMFTSFTALLVMFMSVVFVAKVAVMIRSKSMATAGLFLAGMAPILASTSAGDTLGLFLYLTVIVLGSLWVLTKINAYILQLIAFIIVVLYSLPYINASYFVKDIHIALTFGFIFTIIFFVSNIISIFRSADDKETNVIHLLVAVGSGLFLASWISEGIPAEWQSLQYIAWAIAFAFGAFAVFVRTQKQMPFYIYSSVSIGLLAAATAAIFDGPVLTLVYTVEVTTLVVLAVLLLRNASVAAKISLLFVVPILLSLDSISTASYALGILHQEYLILVNLMLCLGLSGHLIMRKYKEEGVEETLLGGALAIFSALYGLAIVWLMTHATMNDDSATMASLLVYTVAGLALYAQGRSTDDKFIKTGGTLLVAFVIARLLFIDVWQMEISGRIITFLLIGILLISTAFIKKFNQSDK